MGGVWANAIDRTDKRTLGQSNTGHAFGSVARTFQAGHDDKRIWASARADIHAQNLHLNIQVHRNQLAG